MKGIWVVAAVLLLLPASAAAETVLSRDFARDGLQGWQLTEEVTLTQTDEGLLVSTQKETVMRWPLQSHRPIHAMTLTLTADGPGDIGFLWHKKGAPEGQYLRYQIPLPRGIEVTAVPVGLSDLPDWDSQTDAIGFILPAGRSVLLQRLEFQRTTALEQLGWMWESFWTFDVLSMRTINFLWGPHLSTSSEGQATLFANSQPSAPSANMPLTIIAIAGAAVGWWLTRSVERSRQLLLALAAPACIWLLYDLRMSLELLSYAHTDYRDYIAPIEGREPTLRHSDDAFAVLEALPKALSGATRYGLLSTSGFPVEFFRYATAPAAPVVNPAADANLPAWVVFHRSDITAGSGGLVDGTGRQLTPPGRITTQLSSKAFVYTITK